MPPDKNSNEYEMMTICFFLWKRKLCLQDVFLDASPFVPTGTYVQPNCPIYSLLLA